jgi:hypothetical protein
MGVMVSAGFCRPIANDSGRYFAVTEAAQRAVVEDMGSPVPSLEDYEKAYRGGQDHYSYVRAVGSAVAELLSEWLGDLPMDEWWKAILSDVLSLESSDIRDALGKHYLPEPDDMRDLMVSEYADDQDED